MPSGRGLKGWHLTRLPIPSFYILDAKRRIGTAITMDGEVREIGSVIFLVAGFPSNISELIPKDGHPQTVLSIWSST